jgi:S1/P1 Nuclease
MATSKTKSSSIIRKKYGAQRHKTIADVAHKFLTPTAKEAVRKLLKKIGKENLSDIAAWADEIKPTSSHLPNDIDTQKFLKDFPTTNEWHFVNLPVNATAYDTTVYAAFTREDDVVHIAVECINILMDKSTKFSKLNALRWITHLVGDMHQPLHLACSYIDASGTKPKLVLEKEEILNKNLLQKSDRGGNKILLMTSAGTGGKALHSYWDTTLPAIDDDFSHAPYDPPPPIAKNKLITLPALWVGDNVQFAKEAYKGLTVKSKDAKQPTKVDVTWSKSTYDKRCVPIVKRLSLKGASRLAFLLNSIFE